MSMFERTERGLLARWWWTVDRPMLAGIGLLVLSGMVFVFASSPPVAARLGLPHLHFAGRHALYLVPAAVLLLGSSLLSPIGVFVLAWLFALVRVTAPDTPVPYSPPLEEYYLPGKDDVLQAARKLLAY
jgi:cell division protein FtsW